MKKLSLILFTIVLIVLALSLVSCNSDADNTNTLSGTDISSNILKISGNNLTARLPSATESFSFDSDISRAKNATISVSKNSDGSDPITGDIALGFGNNRFFLTVKNADETKTYTVSIYRLRSYTVSFHTGLGSDVDSISVDEDSLITPPEVTPTWILHTFDGWNYDFSTPITKDLTIEAKWKEIDAIKDFEYIFENSKIRLVGVKNKDITTAVIPEGTTHIGSSAFAKCTKLTSITFPESSLLAIDTRAFSDCQSLKSVSIPASITYVGDYIFEKCGSLEQITLPYIGSTPNIQNRAWSTCIAFYFGSAMFSGGTRSVQTLPTGDPESPNTYRECYIPTTLKKITVQGGYISVGAFSGLTLIESVVLEENVKMTAVAESTFRDCRNLKEVILPAGITLIDQFAFVSCSSLEKVYFTDTDVSAIEIAENNDDLTVDKIYAYSAEMPTESGRFWHYDDNGEPTAW